MTEFLHKIKAYLFPNWLTEDPNDYSARVSSERTLNIRDVCNQAVTRGGAATTAEAMEHNVTLFLKEMSYQLANGLHINTGYFTAVAKILGVFNKATEKFNTDKHQIVFNFVQGSLLRKEIPFADVEILGVGDSSIFIDQVTDVKTGSVNDLLTPNRNLRIGGYKLKIAGDNPDNGIYFINNATQERTKVDESDIVNNNPSELLVVIPELASGTYTLEVVTQYTGNKPLNESRTAVLDRVLTVE